MLYALIWISAICLLYFINYISISKTKLSSGSDQHYHLYCIKKIKWNKNKFFRESPEIVLPSWKYPLLYHWCLSFIPLSWSLANSRFIALAVDILNYLIGFLILYSLMPNVGLLVFATLAILFIINPNAMNVANARNTGLSARGFGSAFAILCFAFIWAFNESGDLVYLFLASLMFALVLLSSEMAIQAVVLGMIVFCLIETTIVPIAVLPLGYFIANVISDGYAKETVLYKIDHLNIYSKYLVDIFILNKRKSIWLDLFRVTSIFKEKGLARAIKYYWTSPLANFFLDFPLNSLFLITFITNINESLSNPYLTLALLPQALFVLTSFKRTRFLGEPERYSEYFQVFCMLFIVYQNVNYLYVVLILILTALRIYGNLLLYRFTMKQNSNDKNPVNLQAYVNKGDIVAANNLNVTKQLLGELPEDKYYSVFYGGITKEFVFDIPFSELYKEYPFFNDSALLKLIERTTANVCIVEKQSVDSSLEAELFKIGFEVIYKDDSLSFLRKT